MSVALPLPQATSSTVSSAPIAAALTTAWPALGRSVATDG